MRCGMVARSPCPPPCSLVQQCTAWIGGWEGRGIVLLLLLQLLLLPPPVVLLLLLRRQIPDLFLLAAPGSLGCLQAGRLCAAGAAAGARLRCCGRGGGGGLGGAVFGRRGGECGREGAPSQQARSRFCHPSKVLGGAQDQAAAGSVAQPSSRPPCCCCEGPAASPWGAEPAAKRTRMQQGCAAGVHSRVPPSLRAGMVLPSHMHSNHVCPPAFRRALPACRRPGTGASWRQSASSSQRDWCRAAGAPSRPRAGGEEAGAAAAGVGAVAAAGGLASIPAWVAPSPCSRRHSSSSPALHLRQWRITTRTSRCRLRAGFSAGSCRGRRRPPPSRRRQLRRSSTACRYSSSSSRACTCNRRHRAAGLELAAAAGITAAASRRRPA